MGVNNRRLIKYYRQTESEIVKRFAKKYDVDIEFYSGERYFFCDLYSISIEEIILDLETDTAPWEFCHFIDFGVENPKFKMNYSSWLMAGGYANINHIKEIYTKQLEQELEKLEKSVSSSFEILSNQIKRFLEIKEELENEN